MSHKKGREMGDVARKKKDYCVDPRSERQLH